MKIPYVLSLLSIVFISCNFNLNSDVAKKKLYKLNIQPAFGAIYNYSISNESNSVIEWQDKKIENGTKGNFIIEYSVQKDSSGGKVLRSRFKKIHIITKSNDQVKEMDADKGAESDDIMEKLLYQVKSAVFDLKISSKGEITQMHGFDEITDKIIALFPLYSLKDKSTIREQWEKFAGNEMIQENMSQIFKIFPDSAVRIDDKWKINSKTSGLPNARFTSYFTLKSIHDGLAILESEAIIKEDSVMTLNGNTVNMHLDGVQNGSYEMDMQTGMLFHASILIKIKGNMETAIGQKIPLLLDNKIKIQGLKE